jgi:hypothetical protein
MNTTTVSVSAWAQVGDSCQINYRVVDGDEVEMQFGHYTECFEVSLTMRGLERLAAAATNGLRELQAKAAEGEG